MDEKRLAEIEARDAKRTQGRWRVSGKHENRIGTSERPILAEIFDGTAADVEFIAHASEDVPALCAEVRALHRKLAEVTAELRDFRAVSRGRL